MAEYSANAVQTVNPGESFVFTTVDVPCERGFVRFRPGTGAFLLSGWLPSRNTCGCSCNRRSANFLVDCGANIAIPEGGTVEAISAALVLDGITIPASQMIVTPAAVDNYFNISRAITVPIWRNCCQTLTIRNTSAQPILVQNANIIFSRPDLAVSY